MLWLYFGKAHMCFWWGNASTPSSIWSFRVLACWSPINIRILVMDWFLSCLFYGRMKDVLYRDCWRALIGGILKMYFVCYLLMNPKEGFVIRQHSLLFNKFIGKRWLDWNWGHSNNIFKRNSSFHISGILSTSKLEYS